jgi:hypothetical protein
MCSGVRSILGSLCRSADVQLWIDEEHAPRQRKVVKAFEQKLGGLDSNGEVAVVDRGQRKVTDPGKVGVVIAHNRDMDSAGDISTDRRAATLLRSSGHSPGAGTRLDRTPHRSPVGRPTGKSPCRMLMALFLLALFLLVLSSEPRGENGHHSRKLVLRRRAFDDGEYGLLIIQAAHSGMLPCFFGGSVCRLVRSNLSALVISTRVSCGLITAST